MAEKDKDEKKPNGGAPPTVDDPDKEFWEAEGITDDDEKDAVRSRARVIRYADWRKKRDEENAEKEKKGKKKTGRPWFKED